MAQNIRPSRGLRAKYGFNEGKPNEGSPTLVGFEDARPGWVRFLAGLGGVQGPDVAGMNAQLAMAREATTARREEQADKLRAELEQLRERAATEKALLERRLAGERTNALDVAAAQAKGRIREQRVIAKEDRTKQNEKALLDREQEIIKNQNARSIAELNTYLAWAAKTGANPNDPESMRTYTELQRQIGSTALRRAKSFDQDKQLDEAAKLSELGSLLAPHAKTQKDYTTIVNEKDAAMFGAPPGVGMPRGMLFGATPGTPASLNAPGTPPTPARFEATPDMAAIRAGSTAMPVGRGRAFEDLNMRFVGGEQAAPSPARIANEFRAVRPMNIMIDPASTSVQQVMSDEERQARALKAYESLMQELQPGVGRNIIRF